MASWRAMNSASRPFRSSLTVTFRVSEPRHSIFCAPFSCLRLPLVQPPLSDRARRGALGSSTTPSVAASATNQLHTTRNV